MSRFTIFVGGVHGSGKGHLCQLFQQEVICDYVSASSLLHWATIDKMVEDIDANQELLASLLPEMIEEDKVFLIDGHFALWNKKGSVERVSSKVFEACKPNLMVCMVASPEAIVERLNSRDHIQYTIERISQLQSVEIENAKCISEKYNIPLYLFDSLGEKDLLSAIREIKFNMTEYTRDNIYSEMLKTVIIRFDFLGSTSIRRFVDSIKQDALMKEAFAQMRMINQNQYTIKVMQKEVEDGSLPVTERQNNVIYHFFDCKIDDDLDVVLDIAVDSVCLSIDCRQKYNGSKKYTDFMVALMLKLIHFDPYISIERIGVRKIDAQVVPAEGRISQYFNENYLAANSWYSSKKESVNYAELFKIGKVNFNVVQHIDRVLPSGQDRAIFDVDAFIVNGDIRSLMKDESSLRNFLNEEVQNRMFDLFIAVASRDYLEKCKNAKLIR